MLSNLDLFISVSYVVAMIAVGFAVGMKRKLAAGAGEYFLAGKSLRWPMIGLALFATNISCVHLVSLAQSGFDTGLLNGNFEWMAAFTLVLLAIFFAPFYIKSGVATLPDFLERRYDRSCRDWLTVISLVSAIVIHIAFSLLAGGVVIEALFGIDMYISVSAIALLVALYTILGGLRAVVVTESVQTVVLIVGALAMSWASWDKLGGWQPLVDTLAANNELDKLSMLRPADDESGMPWFAVFLGYPILGIWYWCADQTIVQRVLGAKDVNHARLGAIFCGFIKILPVFIFVLPGLFAYAMAERGLLDVSPISHMGQQGEQVINSKGIYTLMITQLLPTGLVGVVVAALLSGLMSQVSGALNSVSTLVSYDILKRYRPASTDRTLIRFGRIAAAMALLLSLLLLPLLNLYESIFMGLNDIIAHIAPPITCVFLLGVFWRKASAISAKYTLWIGSVMGVLVYVISKVFPDSFVGEVPFMMMAFYLFLCSVVIQVSLSLRYPYVQPVGQETLYWKSVWEPLRQPGYRGLGNYRLLSACLVLTMAVLYIVFK